MLIGRPAGVRENPCWPGAACGASLPPLSPTEGALETSNDPFPIAEAAGNEGGISRARPYREPHHTASVAAIVGGGKGAKPGEIFACA